MIFKQIIQRDGACQKSTQKDRMGKQHVTYILSQNGLRQSRRFWSESRVCTAVCLHLTLLKKFTVQTAELYGFRHMRYADGFALREICDCTGDSQNPIVPARGKLHGAESLSHQLFRTVVYAAVFFELP